MKYYRTILRNCIYLISQNKDEPPFLTVIYKMTIKLVKSTVGVQNIQILDNNES